MCVRLRLLVGLVGMLSLCVIAQADASVRVFGTLLTGPDAAGSITIETPLGTEDLMPSEDVKVQRGRVGQRSASAALSDLLPGDYVAALRNPQGFVTEIAALYDIWQGKISKVASGSLVLSDGRKVKLRAGTQAILPDGSADSPSRLKPGAEVTCRISPISKEAWVVIAAAGDSAKASSASPVYAKPAQPKISSLTYTPTGEIHPGDTLTVELCGTPGGKASFDVMLLLPVTEMAESTPGCYRAEVTIPSDGSVSNAPLVGYLTLGNTNASPVQAGKLLTVKMPAPEASEPVAVLRPAVASGPTPAATRQSPTVVSSPAVVATIPQPAVVAVSDTTPKQPERPRELADIVLKTPANGSKLKSAILVTGKASPDSKVAVTITYNNGLTGLLKLAGQVVSQVLAVGKNGEFRMGPIALDGPLATKGLRFTIKAYYPDRSDHGTAAVVAIGDRT